jgi:hypothetical protein
MSFEITKALCLSTAHISEKTANKLDSTFHQGLRPLEISLWHHREFGYFMPAYPGAEPDSHDLPEDLMACLKLAHMNGCEFLRLDSDGPTVEELPTYDW